MALNNFLLIADVAHARLSPKRHAFAYKVFYLCAPLRAMANFSLALISSDRWNLFGVWRKDYGALKGLGRVDSFEEKIQAVLSNYRLKEADGEVVLLTMPRLFGYAFNPVSFWFCLDTQGGLRAVVCEVNNTFGERHSYVCFHDDHRVISADDWIMGEKVFHVSPFLKVEGTYRYRFAYGEEKIGVWIEYFVGDTKMLVTSLVGKRQHLSSASLLLAFIRYPLVTFKVIFLIHYHALRLVMRGIRFYSKPQPPLEEVSR